MTTSKTVTAFKGFDGGIKMCETGFHACEDPFDVWNYYGPCDARFARVEMAGAVDRKSDGDSKVVSAAIHISAELSLPDFIKTVVQCIIDACEAKPGENAQAASGSFAQLAAAGNFGQPAAAGDSAQPAAAGDSAQLAAAGDSAQLAADG